MGYRAIHDTAWKDSWFFQLSPTFKLLYIYLYTNSHTSATGLYELSLTYVSFETGLPMEQVEEGIQYFRDEAKIDYDPVSSVIWFPSMWKYQGNKSPTLIKRAQTDVEKVPNCMLKDEAVAFLKEEYGLEVRHTPNKPDQKDKGVYLETGSAIAQYEAEIGVITPHIADTLSDYEERYGVIWLEEAIKIAAENNVRRLNYVTAILDRWGRDGKGDTSKKPTQKQRDEWEDVIKELGNE